MEDLAVYRQSCGVLLTEAFTRRRASLSITLGSMRGVSVVVRITVAIDGGPVGTSTLRSPRAGWRFATTEAVFSLLTTVCTEAESDSDDASSFEELRDDLFECSTRVLDMLDTLDSNLT